jgi:hypothetical protein
MQITIQLKSSVNSVSELSKAISAFETLDEVYRLMKAHDYLDNEKKIDFRRKRLRESQGSKLAGFRVASPPSISVNTDDLWIAALIFFLKDYSSTKKNIIELANDLGSIPSIIQQIGEDKYMHLEIGVKLFSEQLNEFSEEKIRGFMSKIEVARKFLHVGNIETVKIEDEDA